MSRKTTQRRPFGFRFEPLEARCLLDASGLAGPEGEGDQVSDFALIDVNPTSPTYDQPVSPRDYLNKTSAWYLGDAM